MLVIIGCIATAVMVLGLCQHWSTGGGNADEDSGFVWIVALLIGVVLALSATDAKDRTASVMVERVLERAGLD